MRAAANGALHDLATHPGESKRRTDRKRAELEECVRQLVPPTHPLFDRFFAERRLCLEYEERERERREAKQRAGARAEAGGKEKGGTARFRTWEEYQSAKYGVAWQRNEEVPP